VSTEHPPTTTDPEQAPAVPSIQPEGTTLADAHHNTQHAWWCHDQERTRAENAERELAEVQTENDALTAADQRNRLMASLWTLGITLAVFSVLLCLVYDGFLRLFRAQERAASHD